MPLLYLCRCRNCDQAGYQPFKDANGVSFWIKQDDGSGQASWGGAAG